MLQPERRLANYFTGICNRQRTTLLHQSVQIDAVDKFHHEVVHVIEESYAKRRKVRGIRGTEARDTP